MKTGRMKGQGGAETTFVISFIVLISVLIFLLPQMSVSFPGADIGNLAFDFTIFVAGVIGSGIACASFAGITCAIGVGAFAILTYLTVPPILSVIFIPLTAIFGYVLARLARGGG